MTTADGRTKSVWVWDRSRLGWSRGQVYGPRLEWECEGTQGGSRRGSGVVDTPRCSEGTCRGDVGSIWSPRYYVSQGRRVSPEWGHSRPGCPVHRDVPTVSQSPNPTVLVRVHRSRREPCRFPEDGTTTQTPSSCQDRDTDVPQGVLLGSQGPLLRVRSLGRVDLPPSFPGVPYRSPGSTLGHPATTSASPEGGGRGVSPTVRGRSLRPCVFGTVLVCSDGHWSGLKYDEVN